MSENYLTENYKTNYKKFQNFAYANYKNRVVKDDIDDIFHECIYKMINSKAYKNNDILDPHGYFWIILRNEIKSFIKDKVKKNSYNDLDISEYNEDILEELNDIDKFWKPEFLKDLNEDLKHELNQIEYDIYYNYTFNNCNLKQIAELIGYSESLVYSKSRFLFKKIKVFLDENKDKYNI